MKEYKYLKEEFHRGKWQPLMVDRKGKQVQGYAKITEEQAYWMNRNKDAYKVRYVLDSKKEVNEESDTFEETKKEYEDLAGKKAFHGWNEQQLKDKIAELKK